MKMILKIWRNMPARAHILLSRRSRVLWRKFCRNSKPYCKLRIKTSRLPISISILKAQRRRCRVTLYEETYRRYWKRQSLGFSLQDDDDDDDAFLMERESIECNIFWLLLVTRAIPSMAIRARPQKVNRLIASGL